MPGTIETESVEQMGRSPYDVRFAANESRIAAEEVDLAVIRNSFATKDDVQRILALLYEHKLEMQNAMSKQREDFYAELSKQRQGFDAALSIQREDFHAALSKQREDFNAAFSKQREDFNAVLARVQIDLNKTLISHIWKLYGLASLVLGGVYYIARYVH